MADRILAGTRKGLFTITRANGGAWRIEKADFLGDNVSMVGPLNVAGGLVLALDHGHFGAKMHRSLDGGQSWEECATPAYPPKPDDHEEPEHPVFGTRAPWSLKRVWSLEVGHDGVVWAGTIPGGLFTSTDNGDSWELNRPLWDHPDRLNWFGGGAEYAGIHSICVDPRDAGRVAVGVSTGGLWLTEDGGATWANHATGMRNEYLPPDQAYDPNAQDDHRVVQCVGQPDYYWAQHHNGIFRCTNNLQSWTEIENAKPSVFGFAVAVHPRNGDTAWFVPAVKDEFRYPPDGKLVVSRTVDGGKSFEVLRNGLPQEHAYDLTWRHGLDVDESGGRLTFGTTSGSLYVSENGGDAWQEVSAHLPPIHCVRFVQ